MRLAAARFLALVALTGSLGYLLQADDSSFKAVAVQPPARSGLGWPIDPPVAPGTHDYYSTHRAVIPFGRTSLEIPILLYHYIRTPPPSTRDLVGYNLSVAPVVFSSQLDWLAAHGYHTITFQDVRQYWNRVAQLPSRPVIITLDDGYQDLYSAAYPILVSHGFKAVAYIVSAFVGRRGYVTADEVVEMDRHGIEIGAHTVDHVDLASTHQPWLSYQLVASKSWLEKLLGHSVPDMAYPSGKFNPYTIAAVQHAGYDSAVTEEFTIQHSQADRYVWGRVRVSSGEPMTMFIANLGRAMPTETVTKAAVESTPAALQQRT
jgi:peptidoglycan/xylan/chitin deacetylase (PgdA/CDA1 family)